MAPQRKYMNWVESDRYGLCGPCLTSDPPVQTRTKMQFHWEPTFGEEKELVGNIPVYCCSLFCLTRKIQRHPIPVETVQWVQGDPNVMGFREDQAFAEVWREVHSAGPLCALVSGNSDGQSQTVDVSPLPEVAHESFGSHHRDALLPGPLPELEGGGAGAGSPTAAGVSGF